MGCCGGVQDVPKEIEESKLQESIPIKLLMLGTGSCGKSTIFKQLQYIYGNGCPPNEQSQIRDQIISQIYDCIKKLISSCEEYYEDEPNLYGKLNLYGTTNYNDDIKEAIAEIKHLPNKSDLKGKWKQYIELIWNYDPIQEMFKLRNEISVPDSFQYYMNKLDVIAKDDYIPSTEDILLVNTRTTGMQGKIWKFKRHEFKVIDTGGQTNERGKWIHSFRNAGGIIFVVSLTCYDEIMFESDTNSMVDSLACFNELINYKHFKETPFMLIFNKWDIFEQKIKKVPITVAPCFEHFDGNPNDVESVKQFIAQTFIDQNKSNNEEIIHTFFVNATNKDSIERTFNEIYTIILSSGIFNTGLQ